MKKWLRNRKAVSPVIAALLLIAISVAAAVITYSWVMTMIEGQGSQAQTTIRFEEVTFSLGTDSDATHSQVKMVVRNAGGVTAQIQTLYVYDGDTRLVKEDDIGYAIAAGETAEIGFTELGAWNTTVSDAPAENTDVSITWSADFTLSKAYSVRVVTDNGFTIEGTYYTPSSW